MTKDIIMEAIISKEVFIPLLLLAVAVAADYLSRPVREKNIISFRRFNHRLDRYDILGIDLSSEIERLRQDVDGVVLEIGECLYMEHEFGYEYAQKLHDEVLEEVEFLTGFLNEGPSDKTKLVMVEVVNMLDHELEKLEGFVADPSSYMRPLQCLVNGEVKV